MAYIQTPIRLINVKETYEEVLKAMDFQWMEVTENTSFYDEAKECLVKFTKKIRLNRDYIIEIQPQPLVYNVLQPTKVSDFENKEDKGLQWGDYILATNNLNIIEIIDIFEFKNDQYICNSKSKKNLC